jgi:hypothetical protein
MCYRGTLKRREIKHQPDIRHIIAAARAARFVVRVVAGIQNILSTLVGVRIELVNPSVCYRL